MPPSDLWRTVREIIALHEVVEGIRDEVGKLVQSIERLHTQLGDVRERVIRLEEAQKTHAAETDAKIAAQLAEFRVQVNADVNRATLQAERLLHALEEKVARLEAPRAGPMQSPEAKPDDLVGPIGEQ